MTVRTRLALWFAMLFLAGGGLVVAGMAYSAQKYLFADNELSAADIVEVRKAEEAAGDAAGKIAADAAMDRIRARQRAEATRRLLEDAAIGLVAVTGMAVCAGVLMSGGLLRRVRRVTVAARAVSEANLGQRLNLPGPRDEIKELGDTFDAMLARLDSGIAAQRRFVANASHELRTPLAVTRAAVEVTLAKPEATVAQLRSMGQEVCVAIERAERLVDSLLVLARSEQDLGTAEPDDLADLAAEALDQTRSHAAGLRLQVRHELAAAPVAGEIALLRRAVANLVENAVRHNHHGGTVRVATGVDAARAWVRVENTGPDMSTVDVERLFEPFQRAERTRLDGDGVGLGLSIVAAVVNAHGGTVTATSRPAVDGGGLAVVLKLPGAV